MSAPGDITRLLSAWTGGDERALAELMPMVYPELRKIAQHHWRSQATGNALQPTALIHEAYMKLMGQTDKGFENRIHFFALASAFPQNPEDPIAANGFRTFPLLLHQVRDQPGGRSLQKMILSRIAWIAS